MEYIPLLISPLILLVFVILCFGLWNMLKGNNPNLSQTLMRWRVIIQFIAVCIIMLVAYLAV